MELAEKISKALGLMYRNQTKSEGNVCFANSDELRPEFRETFTSADLMNYEYALLNSNKYFKLLTTDLLPKDRKIFWELVALGNHLKKNY